MGKKVNPDNKPKTMDTTTVSVTIDMGPVTEVSSDNKPQPMDTSTPGVVEKFNVSEAASKVNQFMDVKRKSGEQAKKKYKKKKQKYLGLTTAGSFSGLKSPTPLKPQAVKQTQKTGGNIPGFESSIVQKSTSVKQTQKNRGKKPKSVKQKQKPGGNIPGLQSDEAQRNTGGQQMQKNQKLKPAGVNQTQKNQGLKQSGVKQTQKIQGQKTLGEKQTQKNQGQKPTSVKQTQKNQGQKPTSVKQTQKTGGNIPGFQPMDPQLKTGTKQLQQSTGRSDGTRVQTTQNKQNQPKKGIQSTGKTQSQEEDKPQKSKPPAESLCPMPGCFVDADVKAHILQKHIPSVFYDFRLKSTLNDPELLERRVTGLRMLANELMDPGLDAHHLVKFYNKNFQAKSFTLLNFDVYAMQVLCRYVGWDIPDEFTVCPVNHPAVLIHWGPLSRLLSKVSRKSRKSFKWQLHNPKVLPKSIKKGHSDIPMKHELTLESLDQDIEKFKKKKKAKAKSKRKHDSNSESSDLRDPKVAKLSLNSEEGMPTFDHLMEDGMRMRMDTFKNTNNDDAHFKDRYVEDGRRMDIYDNTSVDNARFVDHIVEDDRRMRTDTFQDTSVNNARFENSLVEDDRRMRMDTFQDTSVNNTRFENSLVEDNRRMRMDTFQDTSVNNRRSVDLIVEDGRRMRMDTFQDTNIENARFADRFVEDGTRIRMDNLENAKVNNARSVDRIVEDDRRMRTDTFQDTSVNNGRSVDHIVEDGRRMRLDTFQDTNIDNARFADRFVEDGRRMDTLGNASVNNARSVDRIVEEYARFENSLVEDGRRMRMDTLDNTSVNNAVFEDRFVENGRRMKMDTFENTSVGDARFKNRLVGDRYVDAQDELQLMRSDTRPAMGSLMQKTRLDMSPEVRPLLSQRLPGMVVDDDFEDVALERGLPVAPSSGFRTMSAGGRISVDQSRIGELGVADQSRERGVHAAQRQERLAGYERPTTGISRLQDEYVAPRASELTGPLQGSAGKPEVPHLAWATTQPSVSTQVAGSYPQPVQRPQPSTQVPGSYPQPVQRQQPYTQVSGSYPQPVQTPQPSTQVPGSYPQPVLPTSTQVPGSYPQPVLPTSTQVPGSYPQPVPPPSTQVQGSFPKPGEVPPSTQMPGSYAQPVQRPQPPSVQMPGSSQWPGVVRPPVPMPGSYPWPGVIPPPVPMPGLFPWPGMIPARLRPGLLGEKPVSSASQQNDGKSKPSDTQPFRSELFRSSTSEQRQASVSSAEHNEDSFSTRLTNEERKKTAERYEGYSSKPNHHSFQTREATRDDKYQKNYSHSRRRTDRYSPSRAESHSRSRTDSPPQSDYDYSDRRNPQAKDQGRDYSRKKNENRHHQVQVRDARQKEVMGKQKKKPWWMDRKLVDYKKVTEDYELVLESYRKVQSNKKKEAKDKTNQEVIVISPTSDPDDSEAADFGSVEHYKSLFEGIRPAGEERRKPAERHDGTRSHQMSGAGGQASGIMGPPPTPKAILTKRGANYRKQIDNKSDSRNTATIPSLFALQPVKPYVWPSSKRLTVKTAPSSGGHFKHIDPPGGSQTSGRNTPPYQLFGPY